MSAMRDDDLVEWIVEAADELAEIAATAGAEAPIPACPGWTMRQLVAHVISGLSGWYTYNLTYGSERLDYSTSWTSQPELPRGNAPRLVRLVESAREFGELAGSVDLDAPSFVFQTRRIGRAWLQRAATETAIHLRDAQEARGDVTAWSEERAAASIDETLRIMWHGALLLRGDLRAERVPDEPITVIATDLDVAWHVTKGHDDFVVDELPAGSTASRLSVAGSAEELVAWLWGRASTDSLTITGDEAQVDAWNLSAHI